MSAARKLPQAHIKPDAEALLRVVLFRPYLRGRGPVFVQTTIGYRLTSTWGGRYSPGPPCVIFEAEDFHGSPMHADDADETVAGLMGFLTLRDGDTDAEYFEGYTEAQRAFCDAHAESLSCEVEAHFGEEVCS